MRLLILFLLLFSLSSSAGVHFINNSNIFSGEVASNLTSGAPLSVSSTGNVTTGLTTISANSSTQTTTTSATDAVLLTVTPAAGTWYCICTAGMQQNIAGDFLSLSFYSGGTHDATSIMRTAPFAGGTLTAGQGSVPYVIHGVYTVNGSQAIAAEWNVSGGTGTSFVKKLTCLRIQ